MNAFGFEQVAQAIVQSIMAMTLAECITIGIAALALVLSVVSLIYSRKTKRYELSETLRKELMAWYSDCITTLVTLRGIITLIPVDTPVDSELLHMLHKHNTVLYTLAEKGRFYFPNYKRRKKLGTQNMEAYRGHRPLIIDLLVETHKISTFEIEKIQKNQDHVSCCLKGLQKGFTTEMFKLINPDSFIKKHRWHTKMKIIHQKTFSESEYIVYRWSENTESEDNPS
jgi:hypothetical protein